MFNSKGFASVPFSAISNSTISANARLLYVFLCYCKSTGQDIPSQSVMAGHIGIARQNIRKYLSELETAGLIKILRFQDKACSTLAPNGKYLLYHLPQFAIPVKSVSEPKTNRKLFQCPICREATTAIVAHFTKNHDDPAIREFVAGQMAKFFELTGDDSEISRKFHRKIAMLFPGNLQYDLVSEYRDAIQGYQSSGKQFHKGKLFTHIAKHIAKQGGIII